MKILSNKVLLAGACLLAAASAAARPYDQIMASNEFIICAAPDDMPFSANTSPRTGMYVDIAELVARGLGVALTVQWLPSRQQLRFAKCDAIMGAAVLRAPAEPPAPGAARTMRSALTLPYMRAMSVIVAAARVGDVGALSQLQPFHVAAPSGSWAHKYLNDRAIPVWVRFRTDPDIIAAVERGDADAGVVSNLAIGWHQKKHGANGMKVFDRILDPNEFAFDVAIKLLDTDGRALDQVNTILRQRLEDGSIPQILAAYGTCPTSACAND